MKIKLNRVVILTIGVVIGTCFMGVVFVHRPYLNRFNSLRAEIQSEKTKNVLIVKINALSDYLEDSRKRMPERKDVAWLLAEVSTMLKKEQIELISIKPGVPEDSGLYTKLYVTLNIASTYNQLGRFISRIESSDKFLKVESINMERLEQDRDFARYSQEFKPFDVKGLIVVSTIVLTKKD